MRRLTLDEVRHALPELDELRPIFDDLLSRSEADGARAWSGSGQLGTVGSRLIPGGSLTDETAAVARREADRLAKVYTKVGEALASLAEGDRASAAAAFLDAAASEERHDRADRALAYAEAAYRAVKDERDRTQVSLATRRAARALRSLGDLEEALRRYRRAHELALGMSDARGAAEAAVGAGNVLEDQGRWDEAEGWYRKALEALSGLGEHAPERWHAILTLHIVARSRGDVEGSVPLLDEAEEAAAAADDEKAAVPFIENARGQLLMARGAYQAAEWAFSAAVAAATDARTKIGVQLNLAESYLAQGRTLDAAEQAREAEREAIRGMVVPKLPEVYRLLGRIASAEGDPDAFVLFERALEIVRDRRLPALEEALSLESYAEAEDAKGNAETAEELRRRAKTLFSAKGKTVKRERWADVFGPARDNDLPAQG